MDPFKTEAWMCPDGDGMMFCRENDGLAFTDLEIDLVPTDDGWNVTEIRMVEPIMFDARKVVLTGRLRESAMAFIIDNLVSEINAYVAEMTRSMDDDYDAKCDAIREMVA